MKQDHSGVSTGGVTRTIKKLLAFLMVIVLFSVYNQAIVPNEEPQTQYLNQIFTGEIGIVEGIVQTIYQGIEFGTRHFTTFAVNGLEYLNNAMVVELLFHSILPLILIFSIWLLPISMILDLLDQRPHEATPYPLQLGITLVILLLASFTLSGFAFFGEMTREVNCRELTTFEENNQTYLNCEIGGHNKTIQPHEYQDFNVEKNTFTRAERESELEEYLKENNTKG